MAELTSPRCAFSWPWLCPSTSSETPVARTAAALCAQPCPAPAALRDPFDGKHHSSVRLTRACHANRRVVFDGFANA